MRPILLSGHERSLTQVKYNADGDLLFTCSKDHLINAWYSHNGERLGTYSGHNGTVWTVDVDSTSRYLLSGSADNCIKLWEVQTGKCLQTWEFPTAIKRVQWSEDDTMFLAVTEKRMGYEGSVVVFYVGPDMQPETEPMTKIETTFSKATVAAWAALDRNIIIAHDNGSVSLYDPKSGEEYDMREDVHEATITDLQTSKDKTWFVTSSKDKSAKILDAQDLKIIKTFATDAPLNSAGILPGKPYILVGGGQDAMSVTTTGARQGHFEIRFWHRIFEEEISRVKGGFGPCNTIAIHPHGLGYSIGGEDGYIRVHHFDEEFFKAKPYGPSDEATLD
ncbi:uncharacterized protein L969DRAFT_64131 [Mixia osmundae IAM 14324]|uniref:Eukaryotic translation initiation factor 3 subunit I n=1 Tax=Mixia osmundae (strain CBS 9802 / IAM 14324 / JCM 22182 / KY 12970) TaxID=764103 RepID=G7E7N6_MIXOS|nr:uncharacterized protein L969DRAFT_64131 [Mixia osmundae IAM 14324]KEI38446.1 hypothetical protein L969DRAFT_64131 [Mixia osmundae IAM 14324]GAA98846.1 hypothetical protein E5Q_05534 [Mixia osmundae IAM 14324]